MTKRADEFLIEAANTFREKNAVYADNWKQVGDIMLALFPHGVTMDTANDWSRMHILVLDAVKLTRYANNWAQGGHADSIHDATVYSAMLEAIDADIKALAEERNDGLEYHNQSRNETKASTKTQNGTGMKFAAAKEADIFYLLPISQEVNDQSEGRLSGYIGHSCRIIGIDRGNALYRIEFTVNGARFFVDESCLTTIQPNIVLSDAETLLPARQASIPR